MAAYFICYQNLFDVKMSVIMSSNIWRWLQVLKLVKLNLTAFIQDK